MAEHETGTPEENKGHSQTTAHRQEVMSTKPLKRCKVCYYQFNRKALFCPNCRTLCKEKVLLYALCIFIAIGFISFLKNIIEKEVKSSKQRVISEQYKADTDTIQQFLNLWVDELRLASQTPRIALAQRISHLQDLKQQWRVLILTNQCLAKVKDVMSSAIDSQIEGFLTFLGREETDSSRLFQTGLETLKTFKTKVETCKYETL